MSRPDVTFHIPTERMERPIIGADTSILVLPEVFNVETSEGPALAAGALGHFLLHLSEKQARDIGEELHHAEFTLTSRPTTVEALGSLHDCDQCRAAVRKALRMLKDEPDTGMLVGQLFWAGP